MKKLRIRIIECSAAILLMALFPSSVWAQQYYPVRDRMEVTNLDGTWMFQLEGEKDWQFIHVPGNWETQGVKSPDYGKDLKEVKGTYKRTFNYKPEWKGRDVILRLDAVQNGFTAFLNGHEVGSGHSAHTMHQFNVTPYLNKGENEIVINVSSHSKYWWFDVCDAWSFTGIKCSVELFPVSKRGSFSDIIFTSKVNHDNSADITLHVKTNGGKRITASLLDERYNHVCNLRSAIVADTATMKVHLSHPRLWNAETPNLYRLVVNLFDNDGSKLQTITEKVGIREVRVEDGRVLLNNREIFLRGVCLSENDAIEGSALSLESRIRQLKQIKDANVNFIRMAHYPLDPAVTRLCDEMGIYLCNEIPFASRGDDYLRYDTTVVAELNARAKATIDRDRNNPSIIMWSLGNENKIYPCQDSVLLFTKNYDPSRLRGVPQAKGAFQSYIKRPSKYVDVICGHYANDDVLADAVAKSALPIINTEYAHSVGTGFGELEHKYEIFRREPKIAGGSVWCYQDQSVLTHNFNQQNQMLKGVRIDSLRYIDNYGLNPVPEGVAEQGKEGADGVVYGDGYPQEDYFLLAQVYTPVYVSSVTSDELQVTGAHTAQDLSLVTLSVENRFDFIPLHGYSLQWQLKTPTQVIQTGTAWLTAKARERETVEIDISEGLTQNSSSSDLTLCTQVLRPNGSLCYERNIIVKKDTDYTQLIAEAKGDKQPLLKTILKEGLKLRVGRPIEISLDYRRKNLWQPYILEPTEVKAKKQKGAWLITCRWKRDESDKHYMDGQLKVSADKNGTVTIDYTLTLSSRIGGKFLDFGPAMLLPAHFTEALWLGQGPFSQTPDKKAYNNRATWQLHKDDIRFYGNRAEVDIMTLRTENAEETLTLRTESGNIHLENMDGRILLTDNLVVGTYASKFKTPEGIDANKLGVQTGRIVLKANGEGLPDSILGTHQAANPQQPYMESYGK